MQTGQENNTDIRPLIARLESLPPERVQEVERFVNFLCHDTAEHHLTSAFAAAAAPAFSAVWDNEDDADYDEL